MPGPNIDAAARKALETLIEYRISTAPVDPYPILKNLPGVITVSFADMADALGTDRHQMVTLCGENNQDAVTTVLSSGGSLRYLVAYNQRLPHYLLQRSLARELGHILLQHDGSRPVEVRHQEALFFARHLICPRPLLHAVMASGVPFTVEMLGNITGCYDHCLNGMRETPGARVPAALNRAVRDQFADYIANYLEFHAGYPTRYTSALADFGTYMDHYEE